MRLGDKLYDNDEVEGTGIYGQRRQTCVQRSNRSGVNPYTDGAGSIYGRNMPKDRIIKVQSEYTILNDIYEDTVFAEVVLDMDGERSRIMHMNSFTTYSVHSDHTARYHLALITNPNAYFIFPTLNQIMHIPADGYVYEVDTTLPHSFVNCGADRTHLVISKRSSSC